MRFIRWGKIKGRIAWWWVSPLSSASFLKGIFRHHIFREDSKLYFYKLGYYSAWLKCLGRDWNRTKY